MPTVGTFMPNKNPKTFQAVAFAVCASALCFTLCFFAITLWPKKKHTLAASISPNPNKLWEQRIADLKNNQQHHFLPSDESEFKRGVQDIANKMVAGDSVVLCVGGGDVLTPDIKKSIAGLDPEFGLPKKFCSGNELLGNEFWSGARYALRWYANHGLFPVNSVKFHP